MMVSVQALSSVHVQLRTCVCICVFINEDGLVNDRQAKELHMARRRRE